MQGSWGGRGLLRAAAHLGRAPSLDRREDAIVNSVLYDLAQQAAEQPGRLAALLLPYARGRGWDDAALAAALGCSLDALPHILLAREPTAEYLEVEARALADAWGAEAWRMIALLRLASESAPVPVAGAAR